MTGYVAGDGGVTGISAHSSPTRQSNFAWTYASPIHYYTRAPCENPTNLDNDSCGCVVLARCFFWGGGGGRKYLVHSRKYGKRTPNGRTWCLRGWSRLDLKRTAVVLVSRGVTLLVCGFDQLVLVMPQTFAPSTETRNKTTKWMNFLLEQVKSPGSQRTAVILGPRGATLPDILLDMYLTTSP